MKLTRNILIALVAGLGLGVLLNVSLPELFTPINTYALAPMGSLFIKLIKMLVVPIVFFSIALGAAGLGDPKKLGRIGGKSIVFFLSTTAIAITLAISLALIIKPGVGKFDLSSANYEPSAMPTNFVDTLMNIIPDNPVAAASTGNMLQIIFFAAFVGLGMALLGEKVKTITTFMEEANEVLMKLVTLVMYTAPFGAFALVASAVGQLGFDAMKAMLLYMLVVVIALVLHVMITYSSALSLLGKMNPIAFFKEFFPVMVVAFSTSSSSATLPLAMQTAQQRLHVPKSISSFVQPLGSTINMDGTAIMQGVATIFIAQAYGTNLTVSELLIVVLTAVLASIGTAGVPGVGLVMLAMVLEQVNLPVEGIALIIGVDRLLDMIRTSVNVSGDAICSIIIAKSEEKHLQKEKKLSA